MAWGWMSVSCRDKLQVHRSRGRSAAPAAYSPSILVFAVSKLLAPQLGCWMMYFTTLSILAWSFHGISSMCGTFLAHVCLTMYSWACFNSPTMHWLSRSRGETAGGVEGAAVAAADEEGAAATEGVAATEAADEARDAAEEAREVVDEAKEAAEVVEPVEAAKEEADADAAKSAGGAAIAAKTPSRAGTLASSSRKASLSAEASRYRTTGSSLARPRTAQRQRARSCTTDTSPWAKRSLSSLIKPPEIVTSLTCFITSGWRGGTISRTSFDTCLLSSRR
ncbi:hypothetical protein C7974DRAFT_398150 [Boeremia exigua]|uniref:uncharacterized protein n=1 Tax=Boeremia exigua TaxID=749465 RepID=UPI001E8D921A|nr:uncharacterized protein C7974DRAFT_398150 [Boeremia exigua]KAH6622372.1 hypothetical protein C7974DRAFT_398150 [Boeremia exigua]